MQIADRDRPLAHPRQKYLYAKLERDDLPPGARELIKEAIIEYDLAFGDGAAVRDEPLRQPVSTAFVLSSPVENGNVSSGEVVRVSAQLHGEGERTSEMKGAVVFAFSPQFVRHPDGRTLPPPEIFPDFIRYPQVYRNGDTNPTDFIVQVPQDSEGWRLPMNLDLFDGGRLAARHSIVFNVIQNPT